MSENFDKKKHVDFLNFVINQGLDKETITLETVRLTLVYFIISAFDVLDSFDQMSVWSKAQLIDKIYSYQIKPKNDSRWGFRGSFSNGVDNRYDTSHIALTYCALCSLIILGDDLKRVNKSIILKGLGEYQKSNGCFSSSPGGESDMRFIYCAVSICYILNDFSTIDIPRILQFIMNSLTYEGAFSQNPGSEAHGGSTYCAVASLKLLGKLDCCLDEKKKSKLIRWCLRRQDLGFEGRPNKTSDTCYTWWIGSSLAILDAHHLINHKRLKTFCLKNQDSFGGFSKQFDCSPDPMHTYLCLSGLSIEQDDEFKLEKVVPELNITERSFKHLQNVISSY